MDCTSLPVLLQMATHLPIPRKLGVLDRLFGRTLHAKGICRVLTASGVEWKLDLANPTHRWLVYGDYEGPHLRRWAERHLSVGARLMVSGANIGQVIADLHPRFQFSSILAVEPDAEARAWLSESLSWQDNWPVTVEPRALGAEAGRTTWERPGDSTMHGAQSRAGDQGTEEVDVVTLDSVVAALGWEHIDLWVLDMEGGEERALRGAVALLSRGIIRHIYLEVSPDDESRRAREFLGNLGYRGCRISSGGTGQMVPEVSVHENLLYSLTP